MKIQVAIAIFVPLFLLQCHRTSEAHEIHRRMNDECNEYVDKIINDLKNDKEYFEEPYKLEDKSLSFHKKLLLINYTAEATIHNGYLYGLSTLQREGDVVVERKGKSTHLKVFLGAGEIKMTFSGKLQVMQHGPKVKVDAKVTYVLMKLDIVPDQNTGENPKLVKFGLEEAKGTDIKVSGLGPLGFFLQAYAKAVGVFFKFAIRTAIESKLQSFLRDKFNDYVVPTECLNA